MAFKGITFAGQNVTPKNDGGLYQAHHGDGILWGCEMAISGDDLVIQSGEFIACGRVCQVDGATNVDLSGRSLTTGYIQVIMNYDLTQGEGSQWYESFVESASTTFPALTQGNINSNDTLYQLELAVVQISGGSLTGVTSSLIKSPLYTEGGVRIVSENGIVRINDADNDYQAVLGSVDDSYAYFGKRDVGGTIVSGIRVHESGTTGVTLYTDAKDIVLRPNGSGDSTGQVFFDPQGYQHGGHARLNASASSVSVTANTVKEICRVQVPKSGVYAIFFNGDFNPTTSGTGALHYGIGYAGPQSRSTIDSKYMNGGAHIYCMSGCVASLAQNDYIYFNIYAPVAGSVSGGLNVIPML